MESQDHKKIDRASGHHNEGHGAHCHRCGWPFPNPHPSARHRRAHKRICGTVEGYKLGDSGYNQHNALDDNEHDHPEDDQFKTNQECSKGVEISITRRTSSGFGSRSSMSARSEDDVFSDAVMDFTEGSVVEDCSEGNREQASTLKLVAKTGDNAVADGGKLGSENTSHGTQYSETGIKKLKNDHSSECLPSSMNDSMCSDLGARGEDGKVIETILSPSAVSPSHDSYKKGSKEQGADASSAELVIDVTANAEDIVNEVSSSHEAIGDCLGPSAAGPLFQVTRRPEISLGMKDVCYPEIDSVEEIKTTESPAVDEANLKQGACIRLTREDLSNPKDGVHVDDDLPSRRQIMLGKVKDLRAGKLTFSSSPDLSEENTSEHAEDISSTEAHTIATLIDEPDPSAAMKPKDIISDIVDSREILFSDTVVTEGTLHEVRTDATDNTIHESEIAAINQRLDHEQDFRGRKLESFVEDKSLAICDDSFETDKAVESGDGINAVHDDGIHDNKDFQFYDRVKSEQSQKLKSFKEHKSLVTLDGTLLNAQAIQSVKGVQSIADFDSCDQRNSQSCDAAEDDGDSEDDRKLLRTYNACSKLTDHVASEAVKTTSLIGDREEGECSTEGGAEKEKLYESEFGINDKGEAEKSHSHDQAGTDPSSTVEFHESEMVKTDFQLKNLQDVQEGDPAKRNSVETIGKEGNEPIEFCAVSNLVNEHGVAQEVKNVDICKVSDLAGGELGGMIDNSSLESDNRILKKSEALLELANITENIGGDGFGRECVGKVDLCLISDHDDDTDSAKNTFNEVMQQSQDDSSVSVQDSAPSEDKVTKEEGLIKTVNDSVQIQGDMHPVKLDDTVLALDCQVDSSSQTDSLEGNWGSVSVLSTFSDVPPANNTAPPSQRSVEQEKDTSQPGAEVKAGCDGSYLFGLKELHKGRNYQNDGANEVELLKKTQELVDDSMGRKKNEEIIAKVTNWSTGKQHRGKQHMALKNLLGEPDHMDDIPTTVSTDSPAKTDKGIHDNQMFQAGKASRGVGKEWNSPARYPDNIKREKTKVRSRPYWAPFICCSSIETS